MPGLYQSCPDAPRHGVEEPDDGDLLILAASGKAAPMASKQAVSLISVSS